MIYVYMGLALSIALLGAITDIRYGRVKNRHLLIAFLAWLTVVSVDSIANHTFVLPAGALAINLGLAFAASLVFYLSDIWAPGDCKLYLLIALTFPMGGYITREGNVFPALDMVVYSFALGYIGLLAASLLKRRKGEPREKGRRLEIQSGRKRLLSITANIGLISSVNTLLDIYAGDFYFANQMLCTLALIGIICALQNRADRTRTILGFLGIALFIAQMITYGAWLSGLISVAESLIIALIIELINSRVRKNTYREISGEEVRPGMILSYATIWDMQNCIDPELPTVTTENRRSRITPTQAEAVRTWCKNARRPVVIVEMMPFAPFIALAVAAQAARFLILIR